MKLRFFFQVSSFLIATLSGAVVLASNGHRVVAAVGSVTVAAKGKVPAQAKLKTEVLGVFEFPAKTSFKKTRLGGISGLFYDGDTKVLWAVSDDRGKYGNPRLYKLKIKPNFKIEITDLVFVKDTKEKTPVLDLESMAPLPWGNWLLASEGDDRSRPPRAHRLLEIKPDGTYVRDYDLPAAYLPGGKPQEPQGLRTNFGFEAMAANSQDGKTWVMGSEIGLHQDQDGRTRLQGYEMKEAWVLQPSKEWFLPLQENEGVFTGLTETLNWKDDQWLFLERSAYLEAKGIVSKAKIFLGQLGGSAQVKTELILDLAQLKFKDFTFEHNYEAMTFGPPDAQGRSTVIVASDNNFEKESTQLIWLSVTESPGP